jgi:hypothetical protein
MPNAALPDDAIPIAQGATIRRYASSNTFQRAIRSGTVNITVYKSAGRLYVSEREVRAVPIADYSDQATDRGQVAARRSLLAP